MAKRPRTPAKTKRRRQAEKRRPAIGTLETTEQLLARIDASYEQLNERLEELELRMAAQSDLGETAADFRPRKPR